MAFFIACSSNASFFPELCEGASYKAEAIRLSDKEKEAALHRSRDQNFRIGKGSLPNGSVKWGYPRELYGSLGAVIGTWRGSTETYLQGILIEGSWGQNDYGGSLGYCFSKLPEVNGLVAGKLTYLKGSDDNKDRKLRDHEESIGLEGSIGALFLFIDVGIFRNLTRDDWYPSLGIGVNF